MHNPDLKYKTKTATEEQICLHLKECDNDFVAYLAKRINIEEYSTKLFEKSITFEAWNNNNLVGLIAGYFNDMENKMAYITNVSIIKSYTRKGIASELLNRCITYAEQHGFKEIMLEVLKDNKAATGLYLKNGFRFFENANDMIRMKYTCNKL